jgi:hypothetical protein
MDSLSPEQVFQALPLHLAYPFLEEKGNGAEVAAIRNGAGTSTLRRAKILSLLREKNLSDEFVDQNWTFARTAPGLRKISQYERIFAKYTNSGGADQVSATTADQDEAEATQQFAVEAQLRDYLAENLGLLEAGLSQWPGENGEAVEFQVDEQGPSRRIDILAKDREGLPVIIELKVNRGHEKTIGQVLYYRSRIKQRFRKDRVRIFIVAFEISPQLKAAASEVSDVKLFNYSLTVQVTAIPS